jgi:hypothetical protein
MKIFRCKTSVMLPFPLLVLAFFTPLFGQPGTLELNSPKQVLQEFIKSDLSGQRLTDEGRSKLSHFFVQQSEPPNTMSIVVVSSTYDLREINMDVNRAKFQLQFLHFYGRIDSSLIFESAADKASNGVPMKEGILSSLTLIRANKNSGPGPASQKKGPDDTSGEWRIDGPPPPICISLATANRYLAEMSRTDKDETRRKNAVRALAKLEKIK